MITIKDNNILIKELDKTDWSKFLDLKLKPNQKSFVSDVTYSIAQSKYEPNYKPLGIFSNNLPVGFFMFGEDIYDKKLWITRFIIDKKYQNKGIGSKALSMLLGYLKDVMGIKEIYSSFTKDNKISKTMFEKKGFKLNGQLIDENEFILVLIFN